MTYWTGRFESKHRVAKSTAQSAMNVKNITKTISERQQLRAVSVYYNGMFNVSAFVLPEIVQKKGEISGDSDFNKNLKTFMGTDDLIFSEVIVNDQTYKVGDIILLHIKDCDDIDIGIIRTILLKDNKIYFVAQKCNAKRHWLQYFECSNTGEAVYEFVESKMLADYKPLNKKGTSAKFMFTLHHFVSFQYQ